MKQLATILILALATLTSQAALKPWPRGIVMLMGGQLDPSKPIGRHPGLAQANVDGMRVKISWDKIEATEGVLNWKATDQAFALAKSLGKKISFSVSSGANTCPTTWLSKDGCKMHVIQTGKRAGDVMPVINDPVYRVKWTRFIAALGVRYDANPTLSYVVMTGIGSPVEWYEDDASYFQSLSPPNPPGTAKWISQAQTFIDAFASAFAITPFFGALANPYGGNNGLSAEKFVTTWAASKYPGRFGAMTNTLNARSSLSFYPCYAINQYHLTQPTGYQMLWGQTLDGGIRDGYDGVHQDPNALDESLTKGVQLGGRFVEIYEPDCENPALQATITSHRAQFLAQ